LLDVNLDLFDLIVDILLDGDLDLFDLIVDILLDGDLDINLFTSSFCLTKSFCSSFLTFGYVSF